MTAIFRRDYPAKQDRASVFPNEDRAIFNQINVDRTISNEIAIQRSIKSRFDDQSKEMAMSSIVRGIIAALATAAIVAFLPGTAAASAASATWNMNNATLTATISGAESTQACVLQVLDAQGGVKHTVNGYGPGAYSYTFTTADPDGQYTGRAQCENPNNGAMTTVSNGTQGVTWKNGMGGGGGGGTGTGARSLVDVLVQNFPFLGPFFGQLQ